MGRKKTWEEHVEDFYKVHCDRYSYPTQELIKGSRTKIDIICNTCDNTFNQAISDHKTGRGCPFCSGKLLPNEGDTIFCDDGVKRRVISKKKAEEEGLDRYFTGKPCSQGHITERYVSAWQCVMCVKLEETKEHRKRYREDNKESIVEYKKQWRKENPDYMKQYLQENKIRINEYRRNRRATNRQYKTSCTIRSMVNRVISLTKQGKTASTFDILGYSVEGFMVDTESKMLEGMTWENHGELWHIDHMKPVSRYISEGITDPAVINALDNLIPMYSEHNLKKSAQTLEEYLDSNPELYDTYGQFINSEV